jgi:hypothetical protein
MICYDDHCNNDHAAPVDGDDDDDYAATADDVDNDYYAAPCCRLT